MSERVLLTSEVSQILHVSEATVRAWESTGRLPAVGKTTRGMRLFAYDVVHALREAREHQRTATSTAAVAV